MLWMRGKGQPANPRQCPGKHTCIYDIKKKRKHTNILIYIVFRYNLSKNTWKSQAQFQVTQNGPRMNSVDTFSEH